MIPIIAFMHIWYFLDVTGDQERPLWREWESQVLYIRQNLRISISMYTLILLMQFSMMKEVRSGRNLCQEKKSDLRTKIHFIIIREKSGRHIQLNFDGPIPTKLPKVYIGNVVAYMYIIDIYSCPSKRKRTTILEGLKWYTVEGWNWQATGKVLGI